MPKSYNQKVRILALYELLKQQTNQSHPLNATQIIGLLERQDFICERKTIYSDIEALQDYGCPIEQIPRKGYYWAGEEFCPAEIMLLIDAVRSANFIAPKQTVELTKKLKGLLNRYTGAEYTDRTFLENRNKCRNEDVLRNIEVIHKAIAKGKQIGFCYQKYTLKNNHTPVLTTKERVASPYAFTWVDDHYYLVANYNSYNNLVNLRLDRMSKVEVLEQSARHFSEVSEYKTEFNIADYTEKSFFMFSGTPTEVALQCNRNILTQIIDRFGVDIFVYNVTDDTFCFRHAMALSQGLVSWILSYMSDITVLRPQELKEQVAEAAQKIAEQY